MKFIHLTDTHFGLPGHAIWGLDPAWRLRYAIESINRHHSDSSFCVITGDLTHFGQEAAYHALADELSRLRVPCYQILGNHDNRSRYLSVFDNAPVDENGFVQCARAIAGMGKCLFLDTTEPGVHHGVFCDKRAQWLSQELNDGEQGDVFLFMHHPPFSIELPSMDQYHLLESNAFEEAIKPVAHRIRHIFFGHVHRPVSGSWRGIGFSTLYGTNHQVALDFTERRLIRGSHEPPQYAVVFVDDERMIVHSHNYMYDGKTFMMDGSKEFLIE